MEDEFLVRQDIAEFLKNSGCLVLEAATAKEALAICRAGTPIDVLFTDINLNGDNSGWEIAEAFRASRPDIAVLYASGNSADLTWAVPNSRFFGKPYRVSDILDACRSLPEN